MKNAKAKIRAWNHARIEKRRVEKGGASRNLKGVMGLICKLNRTGRVHAGHRLAQENILQAHRPGPAFESELIGYEELARQVATRLFAFYLPQFYPFKENDEWWGPGFTEWRNVTRGVPRFQGHLQPRLPRDLGFYDLRNLETIRQQIRMARASGVSGFCFYYYWFDQKRLLDQPLDLFLSDTGNDFPFCLMWANENWTRRWDGHEHNVLMKQGYRDEHDEPLIDDLARYFKDSRYEQIDGRPLFIIYRPGIVPNFKERLQRWRELFRSRHELDPIILMALGFGDYDPTIYGLDGAIEFPPHKLSNGLRPVHRELEIFDAGFSGHYLSYDQLIESSLKDDKVPFERIRTLVPSWDNEARKPSRGMGFIGATPQKYESWLHELSLRAQEKPFLGKVPYVFVNAWNEWAEGAVLEPDLYHGCAYLNATYRALTGIARSTNLRRHILLVGHDAHRHGAQLLLLNIMKTMRRQFGMKPIVLLLKGGALLPEYRAQGEVIVLEDQSHSPHTVVRQIVAEHPGIGALSNTAVCGELVEVLASEGVEVVSLIHELGSLIREYRLEDAVESIAKHAKKIVFPSSVIQEAFESFVPLQEKKGVIRPQGIYQSIERCTHLYPQLRKKLGIPADARIVCNMGFADLRKGFDLFVRLASQVMAADPSCHFLWLGEVEKALKHWLRVELDHPPLAGRLHILPFDPEVSLYLNGSDVFALTSREDSFPSVVLEALACGVPVVAFQGGGGYGDAINAVPQGGKMVPMADIPAMAEAVRGFLGQNSRPADEARAQVASRMFKWADYVFNLLELLRPELKRVSVVVPNYNYARHLPERLRSIFAQDYPVYEVIVLDDCSSDNSLEVVRCSATSLGREITLVSNEKNSGSVFRQWRKAADLATGDYLWIAEADDSAAPGFLSDLVKRLTPRTRLAFSDSAQVDEKGRRLGESYGFYYQDLPWNPLEKDHWGRGSEFVSRALSIKNVILNVSGVLFDRTALISALARCEKELYSYRLAGDWLLYCAILLEEGAEVVYSHHANNVHRRHVGGVTLSLDADSHVEEVRRLQQYVRDHCEVPKAIQSAQQTYLKAVTLALTGASAAPVADVESALTTTSESASSSRGTGK